MLATCGAAAEVPKKLGNFVLFAQAGTVLLSVNPVPAIVNPKKVLLPPSGPTKSGFCRNSAGCDFPVTSNRIGSPPADEKFSRSGAAAPQEMVFGKNPAATAPPPPPPGWPCSVPLLVAKLSIVLPAPSSSTANLIRPGVAPLNKPTSIFSVSCVLLAVALAGLSMIMICTGSWPNALGPLQVAALRLPL